MRSFYEITPLDTLFFRASTPMEAGQYNTMSLFPPPASVLKGALWTTWCNKVNAGRDLKGSKDEIYSKGLRDGKIPIEVNAFLVKRTSGGKCGYYAPAPATWYYDSADKAKCGPDFKDRKLCVAQDKTVDFAKLNMISSAGAVLFAVPEEDAKPLANAWISLDFIKNPKKAFSEGTVLLQSDVYSSEQRIGVGLTAGKKAEDGKLYTSTHIRIHEGISFVIAVDCESEFDLEAGKMFLGGERRLVSYKRFDSNELTSIFHRDTENKLYLSLMPVEATEDSLNKLVASAKLTVTSGWDLRHGFHKPSTSWIPAGAVFNTNPDDSCIPLGTI